MERVGEEFKAESEAETMLLTCLFPTSHSACFSYTHLLKGGTTHGYLGPSTSIINQESTPETGPRASVPKTTSQLRLLLPRRSWLVLLNNRKNQNPKHHGRVIPTSPLTLLSNGLYPSTNTSSTSPKHINFKGTIITSGDL